MVVLCPGLALIWRGMGGLHGREGIGGGSLAVLLVESVSLCGTEEDGCPRGLCHLGRGHSVGLVGRIACLSRRHLIRAVQ